MFPKDNVKVIGYPSSIQKLADLEASLLWLSQIIPLKRLPTGMTKPSWMQYESIKLFRDLLFDVSNEFANNDESGISKIYAEKYGRCLKNIKNCIGLFEANPDLLAFDMSTNPFFEKSDVNYLLEQKKNWYLLIYDTLKLYEGKLAQQLAGFSINKQGNQELNNETLLDSLRQVALLYYYSEQKIDSQNAKSIAHEYGYTSPTSGRKLKHAYNSCIKSENRTGCKGSNIKDLEIVISELQRLERPVEKAKTDLQKASRLSEE